MLFGVNNLQCLCFSGISKLQQINKILKQLNYLKPLTCTLLLLLISVTGQKICMVVMAAFFSTRSRTILLAYFYFYDEQIP